MFPWQKEMRINRGTDPTRPLSLVLLRFHAPSPPSLPPSAGFNEFSVILVVPTLPGDSEFIGNCLLLIKMIVLH